MSFGIEGMAELRMMLGGIKARAENAQPALLRAGLVPLKAAADRIDVGGPGWPARQVAGNGHKLLQKSGTLVRSFTAHASGNVFEVSGNEIVVGTNVEYARYLQDGTAFFARGSTYSEHGRNAARQGPRARAHSGMPARPFLFIDDQATQKITQIFASFIMGKAPGDAA